MLEEIDGALAQLRDLILDKAEGNPLYIEEVLRTLLETGQLRHDGKWRLVAEIQEIQIPNSIQDVVTARIDRLEADAKRVLTVASVIGRQFFYEVLSAIVEASETLDDQLSKLVRLEFIDKHRISPDLEYMFRHAMIQEATYGSILRRRRRMLHRHVEEILEARFAGRGKDISGVLAYHFAQAEMWEKAQGYLFKAGDQCDRLAADSEALHHYQMLVDAYQRAFGDRLDEGQCALVERKIGEAYFRRGDSEMAFRHLQQSLDKIAGKLVLRTTNTKAGIAVELARQAGHALLPRIFLRGSAKARPNVADELDIYRMMAWLVFFNDPERLLLYTLKGLNISEHGCYPLGIAVCSMGIGFVCDIMGLDRLAQRYHDRAMRFAEESGNPTALSNAMMGLAWHFAYRGEWDEALENFEGAARLGWDVGDVRVWGSASCGTTMPSCTRGEFAVAMDQATKMLATSEASADNVSVRWARLGRGMVLTRIGRPLDGEAELLNCLNASRTASDCQILPQALAELADCLLRQGRTADAANAIAEGRQLVRAKRLRGHDVVALRIAAVDVAITGAEESRSSEFAAPLRACDAALKGAEVYRGARPQALRVSGTGLWLGGKREQAAARWRESLAAAEALGAPYEVGLTYRKSG